MLKKLSFIFILVALIVMSFSILLAQSPEVDQVSIDKIIQSSPKKPPQKINNENITKTSEYTLLELQFKDLESAFSKIYSLACLKKNFQEKANLIKEILEIGEPKEKLEVFNKKFKDLKASEILILVNLPENTKEKTLIALKDYISDLGLKSYEADLKKSQDIDFDKVLNFYVKNIDKLDQEIDSLWKTYKGNLEKYKDKFKRLIFNNIKLKLFTSSDEDFSKPRTVFKREESAFIRIEYSAEGWFKSDELLLHREILSSSKKIVEDDFSFKIEELEGSIDLPSFNIKSDQKFGEYTIRIELRYEDFSPQVKKTVFRVVNPEFYIFHIYTTNSLKSKESQKIFKTSEPVVFVIDHVVKIELEPDASRTIEFSVFSPEGDFVPELSSEKELKAVKGRFYGKFAKRIPPDLEPGLYTFIGKVKIGSKIIEATTQFEIIK